MGGFQPDSKYPLIQTTARQRARMTVMQKRVLAETHHHARFMMPKGMLQWIDMFGSNRPVVCEVGFGDGACLMSLAKSHANWNFFQVWRLRY